MRLPFPSGEANLERVLKKVFDKWRSQRHASAAENGEPSAPAPATAPESQEDADVFKRELLTVVSILFIRAGLVDRVSSQTDAQDKPLQRTVPGGRGALRAASA